MNERSRAFLGTAIRHRTTAEFLHDSSSVAPTVSEWVVVAAFYSAVQYINAFLWERLGMEPVNHSERSELVQLVADLRPVVAHYRYLRDAAYSARYDPEWRIATNRLSDVLADLESVATAIVTALDES